MLVNKKANILEKYVVNKGVTKHKKEQSIELENEQNRN